MSSHVPKNLIKTEIAVHCNAIAIVENYIYQNY